jgi:hypothetical protein
LLLAELIVTQLLGPGAPITVAIDDTLFRRRGKKIHAVGWFHDGSAAGQIKLGFGNNWVVVAIVVTLPFCSRPVRCRSWPHWRSTVAPRNRIWLETCST